MNESRLLLLQLRRLITASACTAAIYRKTNFRRLSALNILLQKQKLLEAKFNQYKFLVATPSELRPSSTTSIIQQWEQVTKSRKLSALNGLLQKQKLYGQVITKFKPALVQYYTSLKQNQDAATGTEPTKDLKNATATAKTRSPSTSISMRTVTENIWTIPNALCVMRIGMAPVVAYLILNSQFAPAIAVFAAAGVTDLLDGYIARVVPGQSSVMGSFLDPMADKILVGTLFLSLTYMDLIPVPLTALIIGRDAILIMAGFYIRYQSLDPPRTLSRYFNVAYPTAQLTPTLISKINTGIQLGLVGVTLVSTVLPYDIHPFLQLLWYGTATTTVASAVGYCFAKDTVKLLRKNKTKK